MMERQRTENKIIGRAVFKREDIAFPKTDLWVIGAQSARNLQG
jgi:hypothetical protein